MTTGQRTGLERRVQSAEHTRVFHVSKSALILCRCFRSPLLRVSRLVRWGGNGGVRGPVCPVLLEQSHDTGRFYVVLF